MTDSNRSTMEVFTGASRVKIGNGNFSSVARDQNNYYTTQTTIVQTREEKKKIGRGLPELSEFTEIKRGDIYKTKDGACYSWNLCSNGKDDTEMAVYNAEVNVTGSFGQKKFTVKTYRGRNAMKEWRRDFSRCSKDWLRDVPLFGYNKTSVPLLIFSGELVPIAHIEGGLGWVGSFYIELLTMTLGCSRNELWMDPTQARFCRGPTGPKCRLWREEDFGIIVPSDVEFLEEDVVIRYFTSKQEDRVLLYTLIYSSRIEALGKIPLSHIQVISALTNSTIAFYQNLRWWSWTDWFGDKEVMPDGATRFGLRDDQRKIEVESLGESASWLLQASSVFHAHNVSMDEDLSIYKLIFPYFKLTGTLQRSKRKRQLRQSLCTPIYLIFLPSPHPLYHWSIEPTGQIPLSPEMCKYLGLPFKLSLKVTHLQYSWPTKKYKHIHDYQISRKFDPKTTDLAQSLQCAIFDVVPAENHFQEIVEGQNEVPAELEGVPSLPMVKNDSESVLCSNGHTDHVDDLGGLNDSFSLDSLFYETEGCTNISHPSDDVGFAQSGSAAYTQQVGDVMRWIWGTLFAPSTLEAIEGLDISAAAI